MLDYIKYLQNSVRRPVRLNMLDLILLDPATMSASQWIYTDSEGFVRFRELRGLPFTEIAKSLLANISPSTSGAELAQCRRIVYFLLALTLRSRIIS